LPVLNMLISCNPAFETVYLIKFVFHLKEIVLNSRHPDPRRVWKGGPDGGLRDTIGWIRRIRWIRGIRG